MRSLRAFMRLVDRAISKYGTTHVCLVELEPILFSPPPPPGPHTSSDTLTEHEYRPYFLIILRADLRWVVCMAPELPL